MVRRADAGGIGGCRRRARSIEPERRAFLRRRALAARGRAFEDAGQNSRSRILFSEGNRNCAAARRKIPRIARLHEPCPGLAEKWQAKGSAPIAVRGLRVVYRGFRYGRSQGSRILATGGVVEGVALASEIGWIVFYIDTITIRLRFCRLR